MALRVVVCGDSRVEGYGNKQDFPQPPGPDVYGRTPYSTITGVVATVTPKAGAPGTGFTCGVSRVNSGPATGNIILFIESLGSGYTANNMPTVVVSGGDGVPPNYSINPLPGGGIARGLETYLNANGYPGTVVIDSGLDGQTAAGWGSANFYNALMAEGSAGDPANALIYMDVGINDINGGLTATQYHDNLLLVVNKWVADGYKVMISYPFGFGSLATTTQQAKNPTMQSLSTQIDNIIATNPAMIFKGVDNYSLFAANDAYYSGDGLHQLASGDNAINALLGPRIAQVMTAAAAPANPYDSPPSNEVAVTPGYVPLAPVITSFSGLSTFPNAQVKLTWGAGNWGDIEVQRLTVGAAGAAGVFATIATLNPVTPGDRTTVPLTYTDTAVVFGVPYKYRLIAQGTA